MAVKPNAKDCVIKQQIVECLATNLTLQFSAPPENSASGRIITIQGENLPFGNRDMFFKKDGTCDGGCTSTDEICRPSWLKEVT